ARSWRMGWPRPAGSGERFGSGSRERAMIVEILKFRVPSGAAADFVRRNEEVWTPALREWPGSLRREILHRPEEADVVLILVYWAARGDMEAFPADRLERLEGEMADLVVEQERWVYERVLAPGGAEGR